MNLRDRGGITILELLIVVAILGILMAVGFVVFKPNHAQLAAQEFQAMMRQARFEAVRLTRPVEVTWGNRDGKLFIEAYVLEPTANDSNDFDINQRPVCGANGHRVLNEAPITKDFQVKNSYLSSGDMKIHPDYGYHPSIYWLPNGLAYWCDPAVGLERYGAPHLPVKDSDKEFEFITDSRRKPVKINFVGAFDVEVVASE